jgi:hypothetical protein
MPRAAAVSACMQVARQARTAREGKRSAAPKTRCVGITLVSENGPTTEERPVYHMCPSRNGHEIVTGEGLTGWLKWFIL